jgi:hypothetical protein
MKNKLSQSAWLVIKFILGAIILSSLLYFSFSLPKGDEYFEITEQFTTKDEKDFYSQLSDRHQQLLANNLNKYQYLGQYNLREMDLELTGYYLTNEKICRNDWQGKWVGKYGIKTKNNLLLTPLIQDKIMKDISAIYYQDIYYYGLDKYIDNKVVNINSLIAIMHLYNIYDILNFFYLPSHKNPNIEQDLIRFAKYNLNMQQADNYGQLNSIARLFAEAECYG